MAVPWHETAEKSNPTEPVGTGAPAQLFLRGVWKETNARRNETFFLTARPLPETIRP
jgi:hypothetical protein